MPQTPAQREVSQAVTRGVLRAILIIAAIAAVIVLAVFVASQLNENSSGGYKFHQTPTTPGP